MPGTAHRKDDADQRTGDQAASRSRPDVRIKSLDGLRGVAALVVLLSHAFNAALGWAGNGVAQPVWSGRWWITGTPLHVLWAGPEMVMVFFVLSGYVLVGPAARHGLAWFHASYYPRRIIRLYLPALAAVLFACLLHEFPARHAVVGAAPWLNGFAGPLTITRGLQAATLLTGAPGQLTAVTTVLWSMRWEVTFSALLPVAVLLPYFVRDMPRSSLAAAAGCCALAALTPSGSGWDAAPHYLAIFEVGAFMGFQSQRLPRIARARPVRTGLLSLVCVVLLTASYWTLHVDAGSAVGAPELDVILGAAMAVWLAARAELLVGLLSSRTCQWLGKRSYSLYLVHQPIVITIAFALGGKPSLLLLLLIAIPASLLGADVFWRAVDRRAIHLSRRAAHHHRLRGKANDTTRATALPEGT